MKKQRLIWIFSFSYNVPCFSSSYLTPWTILLNVAAASPERTQSYWEPNSWWSPSSTCGPEESLRVQQGEACRINIMWSSVSRSRPSAGPAPRSQFWGKPWLQQQPPLFSHGLLPMPSPLTHKRDRAGDIGSLLMLQNQAAIVVRTGLGNLARVLDTSRSWKGADFPACVRLVIAQWVALGAELIVPSGLLFFFFFQVPNGSIAQVNLEVYYQKTAWVQV